MTEPSSEFCMFDKLDMLKSADLSAIRLRHAGCRQSLTTPADASWCRLDE